TSTDWIPHSTATHFFKIPLTFAIMTDPFSLGFVSACWTKMAIPFARVFPGLAAPSTVLITAIARGHFSCPFSKPQRLALTRAEQQSHRLVALWHWLNCIIQQAV